MKHIGNSRRGSRNGFLLPLVLVVVSLLTLALYSFAETMLSEYRLIRRNIQTSQQTQIAHSAIEVAVHEIGDRNARSRARFLYEPKSTQRSLGMIDGQEASFSLVHLADKESFSTSQDQDNLAFRARFQRGLENESGKLNINSLPLQLSRADEARSRLTSLPGVDLRIADCILDWMDEDDEVRPLGAESSAYSELGYRPRQGRFRSLAELCRVNGISSALLFGEDQNRNAWLDPNENDQELSFPSDNGDGQLDRGLSAWITVDGYESTLNDRDQPKLNINGKRLDEIYDSLANLIGKQGAQFIVAYRLAGPLTPARPIPFDSERERQRRLDTAEARLRRQLGIDSPLEGPARDFKDTFRSGMDTSRTGAYKIESLADLIGARVLVTIDTEQEILESPWAQNAQSVQDALMQLESELTTTDGVMRNDRMNPVAAPREALLTIPQITEAQVSKILQARRRILSGSSPSGKLAGLGWLMTEAGLSFDQFRLAAPYLTPGGDLFQGFALGRLDDVKTQTVIKYRLDATGKNPAVSFKQTLRPIPYEDE